ncbi:MAG: T9SS type B sorting domain-containing protein, partial [Bacteroidetes bacterium]|nr:T9SS type B sorting domain-containing protein [Bacteroidota bacterium]
LAYNYPDNIYALRFMEHGVDTIVINKRFSVSDFKDYSAENFHKTNKIHGFMTLSHDCRLLVETLNYREFNIDSCSQYLIFHDFDPESGQISNQRIIKARRTEEFGNWSDLMWNPAFSPNDSLIYVSNGQYGIYRLNRFGEPIDFEKSKLPGIDTTTFIQLANNGRIYFSTYWKGIHRNHISEIKYPDSLGDNIGLTLNLFTSNIHPGYDYFSHTYFEDMRIIPSYSNSCNRTFYNVWYDTTVFEEITWCFTKNDSISGAEVKFDFEKSGSYPIVLKAKKANGYVRTHYDTIVYYKKPIANFHSDTNISCQWLTYQFYDSSFKDTVNKTIGENWHWDFGDGTADTIQNPTHVYTQTGTYNVKLIYSNGFCTDTIEKQQAVEIIAAPRPGFKMSQSNYCSPYLLQITDTSLGQVHSYFYDLGDGSDTNIASSNHYYENAGNYKIVQTLTGPTGCVTKDSAILHLTKGFSGNEQVNSLTANVLDNDSIILNWESMTDALSYNLFKSFNDTNYIRLIKQQDTFYTDLKVDPTQNVYAYKIAALDSCQRPTQNSLKLKNILLTGETHHNNYSILYWTPFEEWQNGVEEYYLQYQTESGQFAMVNTSSNTEYQDNRFFDGKTQWAKCYRIMAIEKDGNLQQSISNLLCLDYEAVLWIPTAFSPNRDGLNDSFLVQGIRIEDFNLQLFNRWGEKVFETTDPKIGWDGNFHQNPCAAGVYTYIIKATGNEGKQISLSGSLHLIR